MRAHQREMSGSSIDSHDRRLLNSLRRARAEADLACTMVAIATQEISDEQKRLDQELAKLPPPPPEAAEIRTYIRTTLQDGRARERFIEVAPQDGDLDTVSAALRARPYLSGLDSTQAGRLREKWQRTAMPELVERRAAAVRAREAVGKVNSALQAHVEERIARQLSSVAKAALSAEQDKAKAEEQAA